MELLGLVVTTAVFVLVFGATYREQTSTFADVRADLARRTILNVSQLQSSADLLRALAFLPTAVEQEFAAQATLRWIRSHSPLTHVGALARITVPAQHVRDNRRLATLNERVRSRPTVADVPLFSPADIATMKPAVVVRSPDVYRRRMAIAVALVLGAFWLAHVVRRIFGTTGDPVLLPAAHLLVTLSLMAMAALRDPLRDTDAVTSVAIGVALGCSLLVALSFVDFENPRLRLATLVPLGTAVGLATALLVYGDGPGESGARVNLLGVQPIEPIRILAVLALASYFSRRWELLREISETVGSSRGVAHYIQLPRWQDLRPLVAIVGTLLVFFVLQRDLGPALVLGCLALSLYGVSRGRVTLVVVGFLSLFGGFLLGYALGVPPTLARRVAIWLQPWNNGLTGGDQIAHGQWGLASGGMWGLGAGVGDGHLIPAGHTDLILTVIGEELGVVGVLVVAGALALIVGRMLVIASRAPGDYTAFLALGCALSLAVPAVVISGGLLGLLPLSGVVTPFLSYGKSSMVCNFVALGISLAIARRSGDLRLGLRRPVRAVAVTLLAVAAALVSRSLWIQVLDADAIAVRPSLARQADGEARYTYNPRLLLAARRIARGTIFDRNGFALAADDRSAAEPFLKRLAALGVNVADACPPAAPRCYPLAAGAFHVLGDSVAHLNWAAGNTSFVEREANVTLQGFDDHPRAVQVRLRDGSNRATVLRDYADVLPLVRHKGDPGDAEVGRLLGRKRDVHITLDGAFQALVARALETRVHTAGTGRGAVVVVDATTGALLASASYPWPDLDEHRGQTLATDSTQLLDRARYGLYPPGSTFKLITAAAALGLAPPAPPAFTCERLPDGRVGTYLPGVSRPIRDDPLDHTPHGKIDLRSALVVSCNAYFAQLALRIGPEALLNAAAQTQVQVAPAASAARLKSTLPYAGYGQGDVLASPLRMARVVSAIASDGVIREPSLIRTDGQRRASGARWLRTSDAALLRSIMRDVVTAGTGRALAAHVVPIAGKTGTAELNDADSHSWFVGFAPYGSQATRIAFAVVVEHAGYGGRIAAPLAGDIVTAARTVGLIK